MRPRARACAVLLMLGLSLGLAGCGDPQSAALRKLTGKGYSLSVEEFLRAARAGDAEALPWFVQAGVDPNVPEPLHRTGLLEAVKSGKLPAVQALVGLGATVPREGADGAGLLSTAVEARSLPILKYLLARGVTGKGLDPAAIPPCVTAARLGEREALELLLPLYPGSQQRALFAAAGGSGDVACLSLLVRAGASVLARDPGTGATALLMAAAAGRQAAVELLLSSGANRCVADNQGRTALELAVAAGHAGAAGPLQAPPTSEEQEAGAQLARPPSSAPSSPAIRSLKAAVFAVNSAFEHGITNLFTLRGCREETLPFILTGIHDDHALLRLLPGGQELTVPQGNEIGHTGWILDALRIPPEGGPPPWCLPQARIHHRQENLHLALLPELPVRAGRLVAVLEFGPARDLYEAFPGDTFQIESDTTRHFTIDSVSALGVILHDDAAPEQKVMVK